MAASLAKPAPAAAGPKLADDLRDLLTDRDFGDQAPQRQIFDYLASEGCDTRALFVNWVDDASEWTGLLRGVKGVNRRQIAHIKECWRRASGAAARGPTVRELPQRLPSRPARTAASLDGHLAREFHDPGIGFSKADDSGSHEFWERMVEKRVAETGKDGQRAHKEKDLENLTVADLSDLLTGNDTIRTNKIFRQFDKNNDGSIQLRELDLALKRLNFDTTPETSKDIMEHMTRFNYRPEDAPLVSDQSVLTPRAFELMLKWMRLAELFTPSAGMFKWSEGSSRRQNPLWVTDYCPEVCRVEKTSDEGEEKVKKFFFGCRDPFPKTEFGGGTGTRWVHMDARESLDRLTLLRLAVKYNLHPLAIGDVLDNRTSTKIDRYGRNYVVFADILCLAESCKRSGRPDEEPPRVMISRSHTTIFLGGFPDCDTLLTIHQERTDTSSWLKIWRSGSGDIGEDSAGTDIFKGLMDDLQIGSDRGPNDEDAPPSGSSKKGNERRGRMQVPSNGVRRPSGSSGHGVEATGRQASNDVADPAAGSEDPGARQPPKRMREEKADFLMYEVLQRIVLQLRPIAEAYAKRLGWMRHKTVRHLTQENMDEVADIKLEVYDFIRSIRPMKSVVKHFMDDPDVSSSTRMYLEDVEDSITEMIQDIEHLTKMADTLESAHERWGDKKMNDTLFAISTISAIFLPMQFLTGWYGMNFEHMPELSWERGYEYFWCLEVSSLVLSIIVILFVRGDLRRPRCLPSLWRGPRTRDARSTYTRIPANPELETDAAPSPPKRVQEPLGKSVPLLTIDAPEEISQHQYRRASR